MEIQALIVDDEEQSVRILKEQIDWPKLGITGVFGAYSAMEARKILEAQQKQHLF